MLRSKFHTICVTNSEEQHSVQALCEICSRLLTFAHVAYLAGFFSLRIWAVQALSTLGNARSEQMWSKGEQLFLWKFVLMELENVLGSHLVRPNNYIELGGWRKSKEGREESRCLYHKCVYTPTRSIIWVVTVTKHQNSSLKSETRPPSKLVTSQVCALQGREHHILRDTKAKACRKSGEFFSKRLESTLPGLGSFLFKARQRQRQLQAKKQRQLSLLLWLKW